MARKPRPKLSAQDTKTYKALARASQELEPYDEAVRLALLVDRTAAPRYPKPDLNSPLRLVIGSSR